MATDTYSLYVQGLLLRKAVAVHETVRPQLDQIQARFAQIERQLNQVREVLRRAHERGMLLRPTTVTEEPPTALTFAIMRVIAELEATERLRAVTRSYHAPGQPSGHTLASTPHITRGPNTRRSISPHRSPTGLACA